MAGQKKLILSDVSEYVGVGFGADREVVCELVFNTSMAGYQEIVSDPSYTDQVVVMTYPLIGNYGMTDEDKTEALPLIRRFYNLGFNIEATEGTGRFLKENGIRTRIRGRLSDGSEEILDSIRAGYVSYVINTRAVLSGVHFEDGSAIRQCAVQNGVTTFTSLDTVRIVLDVLETTVPEIATI